MKYGEETQWEMLGFHTAVLHALRTHSTAEQTCAAGTGTTVHTHV